MPYDRGEPVRFEVVNADFSTARSLVIYDSQGNVRTLGTDERLVFIEVTVASAILDAFTLFTDSNSNGNVDAGERIAVIDTTSNSTVQVLFDSDAACGVKGLVPKVKSTAAAAASVTGTGFIMKG